MADATEIRIGNVIRVDGKKAKVLSQEVRGTGKFGKTVHLKLRGIEDGNVMEKSFRAEDKVDTVDVENVRMQYLYSKDGLFCFMNMSTYEQFEIPAATIGRQDVFLKENIEINVLFADGLPVSMEFPKFADLKVTGTAAPTKGGGDSNYKEIELENGLKILGPQFIKEGDIVRISSEDLSYVERVPAKSM